MQNSYSIMQELLKSPPKNNMEERTRWVSDFNGVANDIENENEQDDTGAKDQVSLPPWFAKNENNNIWLYSPPLIQKNKKNNEFEAVRLVVDADNPITDIHVNARTVPVDVSFNVNGQKQFACLIINTNAEQIKDSPLVAIWFLWDTIARLGIEHSLESGLITETWVKHVFEHAGKCSGPYPHVYYKRANRANEYLAALYRLCAARNITESMLHGEGARGGFIHGKYNATPYTNTWIDENGICSCCEFTKEKPLHYGRGKYPYGSILGHVLSIRHRRNAAEYLLKMQQQK